tara:strand:+ start:8392 stop:8664 length:273 start_codon:yes stop_codon:yes gene_type:complete
MKTNYNDVRTKVELLLESFGAKISTSKGEAIIYAVTCDVLSDVPDFTTYTTYNNCSISFYLLDSDETLVVNVNEFDLTINVGWHIIFLED